MSDSPKASGKALEPGFQATDGAIIAAATERLKIRAAIDADGLKALQWVAGGGSIALAQFYFTALQHGPELREPIAFAFWKMAGNT